MPHKKPDKPKKENKAEEPAASYKSRSFKIFSSFEEQENYHLKQMASLSREELMNKLEEMRKFFMREYILPGGEWPPLKKTISIKSPKTE